MLRSLLRLFPLLLVVPLAFACADADGRSASADPADRGAELARTHACATCHGANGEGGFGPAWRGLAGSEVELSDGRTVVADTEYLRRAITDPAAELRAGYTVPMPEVSATDEEVDALVAYVESYR